MIKKLSLVALLGIGIGGYLLTKSKASQPTSSNIGHSDTLLASQKTPDPKVCAPKTLRPPTFKETAQEALDPASAQARTLQVQAEGRKMRQEAVFRDLSPEQVEKVKAAALESNAYFAEKLAPKVANAMDAPTQEERQARFDNLKPEMREFWTKLRTSLKTAAGKYVDSSDFLEYPNNHLYLEYFKSQAYMVRATPMR